MQRRHVTTIRRKCILVDCYALKNRNKVVGPTEKVKQHVNTTEADVVEDEQNGRDHLMFSDGDSKTCNE